MVGNQKMITFATELQERHRSKNDRPGWPHYRKCGFLFIGITYYISLLRNPILHFDTGQFDLQAHYFNRLFQINCIFFQAVLNYPT